MPAFPHSDFFLVTHHSPLVTVLLPFFVTRHFSPNYRAICAIPAKKSERLLSIIAQSVHFRVKAVFFTGHFVAVACVFMHIAGPIFIFNISKGQPPVSDLEKHMSEPPPLVKVGIFPSLELTAYRQQLTASP
jgi:hypothetical protein